MGRYFFGDIEGKFWFGLQPSDAATRFSADAECERSSISYYFDEENLEEVQDELKSIEDSLGENLQKIEDFFSGKDSYRDEQLREIGITGSMLGDYADYKLGKKIEQCIIEQGQCQFEAEL